FSIDSSILSGNRSSAAVPTDFAFGDEWIPTGALDAMVTEVQAGSTFAADASAPSESSASSAPVAAGSPMPVQPSTISSSLFGQAATSVDPSIDVTNSLFGADAQLGALTDNGGRTLTHLPAATSPAIDAGNAATLAGLTTDQRGSARVVGAGVDVGSVEVQAIVTPAGAPKAELAETGMDASGILLAVGALMLAGIAALGVRRRRAH
ncbi:choice-of-anchor Q domain-containing protein, partial [Glaciibacter psychrotolerans]